MGILSARIALKNLPSLKQNPTLPAPSRIRDPPPDLTLRINHQFEAQMKDTKKLTFSQAKPYTSSTHSDPRPTRNS